MSPVLRLGAVVLLLSAAVRLAAQQPPVQQAPPPQQQQVPIFRSGTDVVPLTVTVVDKNGKPLTELAQRDFTIFENGIAREIVGFFPQTMTPGPAVRPVKVWDQRREMRLTTATRRTFLLVLGYGRIQEPTKALDGALTFVRERLLPQDAVAVMAFHRATSFTTDHAAIARVLERFKKEHERLFWEVSEYYFRSRNPYRIKRPLPIELVLEIPLTGSPPLPEKIKADIDRSLFEGVLAPGDLHNTADLLLGMDLGPATGERPWQHQYQFKELLDVLQSNGVTLSDAMVQSSPLKLFAAIEHLRFMDGEKHAIVLGRSRIAKDADVARVFSARANDARVVIDYVYTDGMRMTEPAKYGGSMPPRALPTGCEPCRDLVERTGGTYSSVDMAVDLLNKIDQRTRASYLVGYVPSNPTLDGAYRRVRVEVNRPGATVHYRHGYFAGEEPPPLALREMVAEHRANIAGTFDENATGLALRASASVEASSPAEPQTVVIDLVVDVSPVEFTVDGGVRSGDLQVYVYCGDEKEQVVGELKLRWNLRVTDETLAGWQKDGLQRTLRVPVTAKAKYVKVIVYDPGSDRTGSISMAVK